MAPRPGLPRNPALLCAVLLTARFSQQWPQHPPTPAQSCPEDPHRDPLQSPQLRGLNSDPHSSSLNSACLRAWGQASLQAKVAKLSRKAGQGRRSVARGELATWGLQRPEPPAGEQRGLGERAQAPAPASETSASGRKLQELAIPQGNGSQLMTATQAWPLRFLDPKVPDPEVSAESVSQICRTGAKGGPLFPVQRPCALRLLREPCSPCRAPCTYNVTALGSSDTPEARCPPLGPQSGPVPSQH